MNESFSSFDDASVNAIVCSVAAAAFASVLLICAWSMKLACGFCGGREIGILRGLTAAVACTVVGTATAHGLNSLVSQPSASVASLYGLAAAVGTVSVVLVQNPLRALCTSIAYMAISGAFCAAAAAAFAALLYVSVDRDSLEQMAKRHALHGELVPIVATSPPLTTLDQLVGRSSEVQDVLATQPPNVVDPPAKKTKLAPGVKANPFVK